MAWNDGLNPESSAYKFASDESKIIRVVAGPGTGKSFGLRRRVARLIEGGQDPKRILAVTFTRTAAQDLKKEIDAVGVEGADKVIAKTLHSFCFGLLCKKDIIESTGRYPRPMLDFEQKPMLYDIEGSFGNISEKREKIRAFEAAWARLQSEEPGFPLSDSDREFQKQILQWLKTHKSMMFGEMIIEAYHYLRNNPLCAERHEFDHVLVDEYQDLNKAEQGFLEGRVYAGIDSLNSAALEWLDRECNGTTHDRTRKAPRELFREESKHLAKVELYDNTIEIRSVSDKNAVIYEWSKYELPRSRVKQFDQIRIEENEGTLMFYKAETGELIYKCKKAAEEGGDIPYKDDAPEMETVGENLFRRIFDDVEGVEEFISRMKEQNGRYATRQFGRIVSLAKTYSVDQVETAIEYCLRVGICSLNEVQAYLLYRYGVALGKCKMSDNDVYNAKHRAEEIAEEQNGRLE